MSTSDALDQSAPRPAQKRKLGNALWQPFVQFRLLMFMLGSTVVVALLLGVMLFFTFGDLIAAVTTDDPQRGYYAEMIETQLVHLISYCGVLFVLYILLLAAVCVAYTHRLVGPLRPFTRHVEELQRGHYGSRVTLRGSDLALFNDYADKLNALAADLQARERRPEDDPR